MQKKEVKEQKKIWVLEKLERIVAPTYRGADARKHVRSVTTRISSMN